jgi:hypothetical protein
MDTRATLVVLVEERLRLEREVAELIEGDRHQPYLDGGPAPSTAGRTRRALSHASQSGPRQA